MLRCAIFADIHGKFLLPFKLVYHYQKITGETIDFILQCGDMGIFQIKIPWIKLHCAMLKIAVMSWALWMILSLKILKLQNF